LTLKYASPLKEGTLLKRYKRFFADLAFNNTALVAHVANSGSMKGCSEAQSPCRFFHHTEGTRKLSYSLEMVKTPTTWVGVNTMRPNQLIWEAWQSGSFSHWNKYDRAQKEVKINEHSRIDMVLWSSRSHAAEKLQKHDFTSGTPKMHLVEIKNVSMADKGCALFPDSVTERGQKHLRDLMNAIKQGHSAEIIYVIQREDCESFATADDIDAEYGRLFREAILAGVEVSVYGCRLSEESIELVPKKLNLRRL
jgi:sugar fermentation stimulation protein A